MRRELRQFCAVLLAVFSALMLALGASAQAQTRLQANKAIARRDARALVGKLRLPHGAVRSATQPPLPALAPPRTTAADTVSVSAWWTSHASPDTVLAYLKAHRPAVRGYYQLITEQSSTTPSVIFVWTIEGQHLLSQQLQVTVATLADGQTGIMAQAQSVWMVPRPAAERVPAGVHVIDVTLRIGTGLDGIRHQHTHRYAVTNAAKVADVVNSLDSLPIVQPGLAMSCPAMFAGEPSLTLDFRSNAGGLPLARTQVSVSPGKHGASGWNECDSIGFWIGGKRQTPLTSRTFVRQVAKLIGANVS